MKSIELFPAQTEQKNIGATRMVRVPLRVGLDMPAPSTEMATLQTGVLRDAQRILFLPHFNPTDYIFYGEFKSSLDTREGFASVRAGVVRGENFTLCLTQNYNWNELSVIFHPARRNTENVRSICAAEGVTDTATCEWFRERVLKPVYVEVSLIDSDSEEY